MGIFGARASGQLPSGEGGLSQALEAAIRVSDVAASAAALPDVLDAMLRSVVDLLGVDQGSIMLVDESGHYLVLSATVGALPDVPVGYKIGCAEGIAGRVLATGRPLLLGDVDAEAFVNFSEKRRRISSSAVVPLRVRGRAIGVLSIAICERGGRLSDNDLRVAQMFADQAAGVIHRARLHEGAEQRSSDLMALMRASRGVVGVLDVDDLLHQVLDGAMRLTGGATGFVCLFDRDSGGVSTGVFRSIAKNEIGSLLGRPEVGEARTSLEPVVFDSCCALGVATQAGTQGVVVTTGVVDDVDERLELLRLFQQQCISALGSAELHEALKRKEHELSSIIDGVLNPMVLVDAGRRLVAMNPAAEELFHISGRFSEGTAIAGTLGNASVERLLTDDGDVQTEIEVGVPARTFKARVTDVRLVGAPAGRLLVMDDVTTERLNAKVQRDFVAMIGHELRTPLTIIKGFARTLIKRVDRTSPQQMTDVLVTIDNKANQLEHIIEDLLYVSRVESREAALRVEKIEVGELVENVTEEMLRNHPEREVHLDVPGKVSWVCDESKVSLVLRHLLDNALKYSDAPEPVHVHVREEADDLIFEIVDRGVGMVSSDVPNIFERFHQIDGGSTRKHGGLGVGLYLSAQLVRIHDGRIWVESTWGKGSTFSFSLPRRIGQSTPRVLRRAAEGIT
jgi:signal transduction histidine kinase/putative methionine-R-sulfoxide reductase with GAF domain